MALLDIITKIWWKIIWKNSALSSIKKCFYLKSFLPNVVFDKSQFSSGPDWIPIWPKRIKSGQAEICSLHCLSGRNLCLLDQAGFGPVQIRSGRKNGLYQTLKALHLMMCVKQMMLIQRNSPNMNSSMELRLFWFWVVLSHKSTWPCIDGDERDAADLLLLLR